MLDVAQDLLLDSSRGLMMEVIDTGDVNVLREFFNSNEEVLSDLSTGVIIFELMLQVDYATKQLEKPLTAQEVNPIYQFIISGKKEPGSTWVHYTKADNTDMDSVELFLADLEEALNCLGINNISGGE